MLLFESLIEPQMKLLVQFEKDLAKFERCPSKRL